MKKPFLLLSLNRNILQKRGEQDSLANETGVRKNKKQLDYEKFHQSL